MKPACYDMGRALSEDQRVKKREHATAAAAPILLLPLLHETGWGISLFVLFTVKFTIAHPHCPIDDMNFRSLASLALPGESPPILPGFNLQLDCI